MTFNEANTVEAFIRDRLCGGVTHHTAVGPGLARRHGKISGLGWHYLAPQNLPRQPHEVLVEDHLREALIRLNPEIAAAARPRRRCALQAARDRPGRAQRRPRQGQRGVRRLAHWASGRCRSAQNGEHVTIRLIDFDDLEQNQYVVTTQFTFRAGATEKRADLVLLVNGIPLVVIEAKTPVRASQSWLDGALQVHDDYERNVPELFVPNVFSVATEGKEFRYGSVGLPVELWGPWRVEADSETPAAAAGREGGRRRCCGRSVVLDLLANFTAFATDKKKQRIKIIARYQQYEAATRSSSAWSPASRARA